MRQRKRRWTLRALASRALPIRPRVALKAKREIETAMQKPAKIISLIALSLVIIPCLLFFSGAIGLAAVKWTALVGTIGWFVTTPMWMGLKLPVDASEVEG